MSLDKIGQLMKNPVPIFCDMILIKKGGYNNGENNRERETGENDNT